MFCHKGFYITRRPAQPVEQLTLFHQKTMVCSFEEALLDWYQANDQLAGEAIFLASPVLYERYRLWLEGKEVSERQQLAMTLYQYLVRMTMRSTPFGLFSGCSFSVMDEELSTYIYNRKSVSRYIRLDAEYLGALRNVLLSRKEIWSRLTIFPNPTLYVAGDTFRYVELHHDGGDEQSFVTATDDTPFLRLILDSVGEGVTFYDLVERLVAAGAEEAESIDYLSELLNSGILFFDLGITLTDPAQLEAIAGKLSSARVTGPVVDRLQELQGRMSCQEEGIGKYRRMEESLEALGVKAAGRNIVQVDTFFETQKDEVIRHLFGSLQSRLSKLMVLNRLTENPALLRFKQRFNARYEEMEVPFNLVLDPETGIGYGSGDMDASDGYTPLLDDLTVPDADPGVTTWRQWWIDFLLDKYAHTIRRHENEIVLSDEDLSYIATHNAGNTESVPYGSFVLGSLLANSAAAAGNGDYLFHLSAFSGPSALPLLGRFACGNKDLEGALRQCAAGEEAFHKDVILAEVIYDSGGKVSNIAGHPAFYRYEIPYLGQASVGSAFQIPLDDLMISVRGGKVILRSRRLNRRVVPRLSNAHYYPNGLPAYRFLCDLQYQDSYLDIRWDWSVMKNSSSLPRVRYQNIILSRATWMLREEELKGLKKAEIAAALEAKGIPGQFVIVSGDNELLIDRNVPCSVDLLILQLRKHKTLRLTEFLMTSDRCWLQKEGMHYAHELVIPLVNQKASPLAGFSQAPASLVPRRFPVGSEWLYLKIYCGVKSANTILTAQLYPAIRKMLEDGVIKKFFFINFSDPEFHLRLRFQGDPSTGFHHYIISAVRELVQPLLEKGLVSRIQIDTYQRELERYGGAHIECCETFFHFDSLATLHFFDRCEEFPDEQELVLYAAARVHHLLSAAGLSETERAWLTEQLKESFFREFRGDTALRKQLGSRYRQFREPISGSLEEEISFTFKVFLESCLSELRRGCAEKNSLQTILISLVHMTVNRIFPVKPRMYELVLYHFLSKHYSGKMARNPEGAARGAGLMSWQREALDSAL